MMNWIKRALKSFGWYPAAAGTQFAGRVFSGPTKAVYQPSDAQSNTIIGAALSFVAINILEPPLGVVNVASDGAVTLNQSHPLTKMLANPLGGVDNWRYQTEMEFRSGIACSLILDGNAYVWKLRSASNAIIGLEWVSHNDCSPVLNSSNNMIVSYRVTRGAVQHDVKPEDMIHIRYLPNMDSPLLGASPLGSTARSILADNHIAAYTHSVLRKPWPSALLSPKQDGQNWTRSDLDALLADFQRQGVGEKAGSMFGMTAPVNIEKLSMSPADMDIQTMARIGEERISACLRIPAVVLGLGAGLDRSTYANYAEARSAATEDCLMPLWEIIGAGLTQGLKDEFKLVPGTIEVGHVLSGVKALQEDEDAKHIRARDDFNANLIDRAEAREAIGRKPGAGDKGTYAWMLKPVPGIVGPTGSKAIRQQAEDAL